MLPRFSFLTFFSGNIVISVFSGGSVVKYLPAIQETRDAGLISGLGISYGKGNGNPLQCSCPEIPTDRASWWAIHTYNHIIPQTHHQITICSLLTNSYKKKSLVLFNLKQIFSNFNNFECARSIPVSSIAFSLLFSVHLNQNTVNSTLRSRPNSVSL